MIEALPGQRLAQPAFNLVLSLSDVLEDPLVKEAAPLLLGSSDVDVELNSEATMQRERTDHRQSAFIRKPGHLQPVSSIGRSRPHTRADQFDQAAEEQDVLLLVTFDPRKGHTSLAHVYGCNAPTSLEPGL